MILNKCNLTAEFYSEEKPRIVIYRVSLTLAARLLLISCNYKFVITKTSKSQMLNIFNFQMGCPAKYVFLKLKALLIDFCGTYFHIFNVSAKSFRAIPRPDLHTDIARLRLYIGYKL